MLKKWLDSVDKKIRDMATRQVTKTEQESTINLDRIRKLTESLDEKEEQLVEKCHFLNTVLDLMPYPVFYKDMEGRFLAVNQAYADFCGRPKDKIKGKTVRDIFTEDVSRKCENEDEIVRKTLAHQEYILELHNHADRKKIHAVVMTKIPFFNKKGIFEGIIGIACDITAMAARLNNSGRYKVLSYQVKRNGCQDEKSRCNNYGGSLRWADDTEHLVF